MAQPPAYSQTTDFSDYQTNNPAAPFNGANHDTEFQNLVLTIQAVLDNLLIIQRDDTLLGNAVVHPDSLSPGTKAMIAAGTATNLTAWVTSTAYVVGVDMVTESGSLYMCIVSHTSGVFATDLAAAKWVLISSEPGLVLGTTVQEKMQLISQAEAEAGTATTERTWNALRVRQAFAAYDATLGKVVQTVNTQKTAFQDVTTQIPLDDTIPQITEGDEVMTRTITPVAAINVLKIDVKINYASSSGAGVVGALYQDAVANALKASANVQISANQAASMTITHYMVAGTTSEITFRVRVGPVGVGPTVTINGASGARLLGGVMDSSITVTEMLP